MHSTFVLILVFAPYLAQTQVSGKQPLHKTPAGQTESRASVASAAQSYYGSIQSADTAANYACVIATMGAAVTTVAAEHPARDERPVIYGAAKTMLDVGLREIMPKFAAQRTMFQLVDSPIAYAKYHALIGDALGQMDASMKGLNAAVSGASTVGDGGRMMGAAESSSMELLMAINAYKTIRSRILGAAGSPDSVSTSPGCKTLRPQVVAGPTARSVERSPSGDRSRVEQTKGEVDSTAVRSLAGRSGGKIYRPSEVSHRALPLHPIELGYPAELSAAEVNGEVVLAFIVGADGRVQSTDIEVITSTHDLFSALATSALLSSTFSPARKGPGAVPQFMELTFHFVP